MGFIIRDTSFVFLMLVWRYKESYGKTNMELDLKNKFKSFQHRISRFVGRFKMQTILLRTQGRDEMEVICGVI